MRYGLGGVAIGLALTMGCGEDSDGGGNGGAAAASGAAGASGSAGAVGTGGTSGSAGSGGTAGSAASAGAGGSAGSGATAGAGAVGGVAGAAGGAGVGISCPFPTDDFEDGNVGPMWATQNSGGMQVAEQAGALLFTYPSSGNSAMSRVITAERYNLEECELVVQVVSIPHESSNGYLKFTVEDGDKEAGFRLRKGAITAYQKTPVESFLGGTNFKLTSHGWLRMRKSGDSLSFDLGPDGKTWLKLGGKNKPFPLTSVKVVLSAGFETISVVPPGTGSFDNFNLPTAP